MANVTYFRQTDMLAGTGFFYGVYETVSSTEISIRSGSLLARYLGNFTYDGAGNVFGRLDRYETYESGRQTFVGTSLNMDAYSVMAAIRDQDSDRIYKMALSQQDMVKGSAFDDRLLSFAGNDGVIGNSGNDTIDAGADDDLVFGGDGDDIYHEAEGNDSIFGGPGVDTVRIALPASAVSVVLSGSTIEISSNLGRDRYNEIEFFEFQDRRIPASEIGPLSAGASVRFNGTSGDDSVLGGSGSDTLHGAEGSDTLRGMDGIDSIRGGGGDDFLFGGDGPGDLRDLIHGDDGNDRIDGGYGNDELHGGFGNDTIEGGFGSDWLIGNEGDDVLSGGAISDLIYGGAGSDFINGGFGFDRYNGGSGADRFYHLGIRDHGTDWIQDYNAQEGDVLLFGIVTARGSDFRVNYAVTPGAGQAGVAEAFVIYAPTGQIMWALVDGSLQSDILVQINNNGVNTIYDVT